MSLRLLVAKDLRREGRAKEGIGAGLVLVALFLVLDLWIFPDLRGEPRAATAALWVPLLFGAAAIAGRGMASEVDRGTIEWLRSLPVGHGLHGASRTIVDTAMLALLAGATLLLMRLLFGVALDPSLILVLALAVVGLGIIGTLAGGLAAQATARDVMLPILLVPVAAPLLLAGVQATIALLAAGTFDDVRTPLLLMLGYDLVAAGVAAFLWPVIMEGD